MPKPPEPYWTTKVQWDWIPLPPEAVEHLGVKEKDEVELVPMTNGQLLVRKKDALKHV